MHSRQQKIGGITAAIAMSSLLDEQREICQRLGVPYLLCDERLKIGISRMFDPEQLPVNGMRYSPGYDTTGWFIWSGEELPTDDDAFVPLCSYHFSDKCPESAKYFGLAPGWRFLVAPGYEDVWYDAGLLDIDQ